MPRPFLHRSFAWYGLLLCLPAVAQRPSRSGIGLKAGGQWSNLSASDRTYTPIPGGLVGVYVPLWAGHRFEIQPELLLSYQGCDIQRDDEEPLRLRMMHLHLPVSAKLFLTNAVNLQGGLQVGRCLSARMDDEVITSDLRPFDVGFVAGLGLDLRSGFDITARYYAGTTPVLMETTGVNPRHRLLQLTAGYRVARLSHRRSRLKRG